MKTRARRLAPSPTPGFPLGILALGIGGLKSGASGLERRAADAGAGRDPVRRAGPVELLGALSLVIGFAAITRAALATPSAA
jgi:hypothetical protein